MMESSQHDEFDELVEDAEETQEHLPLVSETGSVAEAGTMMEMGEYALTDPATGLTHEQVEQRLRKHGRNQLPAEKKNHFKKFLGYFTSPIELAIEAAAILALGLQDWIDAGIICAILLLNAVVGFFQEFQAGNVIDQLKSTLALKAVVIRDGRETEILAKDIVPGDVIVVHEGDVVPADAKLVGEGAFVQVDQSALTGESLAVSKREGDVLYASSPVKRGTGLAAVLATGSKTFVGKSAKLVSQAGSASHFRQILDTIAMFLVLLDIVFIFVIFIQGYYRNQSLPYLLQLTAILTVASVPIALPAVTTTTLAVGASLLAQKKAIVTRLTAIESLAGVDILCSDKTGTLTKNKLTVHDPYCLPGRTSQEMMYACSLASSILHALIAARGGLPRGRKITDGLDPIDKAIFKSLKQYNIDKRQISTYHSVEFRPFDPVTKLVYSVVQDPATGGQISATKGAVHSVFQLVERENNSAIDPALTAEYNKAVDDFASRGFRSLGVALRQDANAPWILIGVLPLFDPPRDDSAQTISTAKSLGVRVKMLTGDQLAIAKETGRQLNMGTSMFDAAKLQWTSASGAEIADYIEAADGFAQVYPEHKYRVVEILQRRGHLIAMTGDGVNDAPALKKADVGIAVEGASEVARAAASMVLLAPGLGVVIDAIKTSRQIFKRMYGYAEYRIAISIQLVLYLTFSQLIYNTTIPVTLVVFLALFADIAVLTIAYDRAETSPEPLQWNLPKLMFRSFFISLCLLAGTFIIHTIALTTDIFEYQWESTVFLELALTQNWMIFSTRTQASAFYRFLPSWPLVLAVFAVDILASCFAGFGWFSGPIGIVLIVRVWLFSVGVFIVSDILQRLLARWSWLDNMLTDKGKSAKRDRKMRELEDLAHKIQLLSHAHETKSQEELPK